MKLLLLSNPNSPHTIKWATSLAKHGLDIVIFSMGNFTVNDYKDFKNIKVVTLNQHIDSGNEGSLTKIKYLKALPMLKNIIENFKPDIIHAHYASSYGLLGAISDFHPFILSVWGSDVFSFPKKSFIHKAILKYVLKKADKLLSTSHVMVKETNIYTDKSIEVTPFGIDMKQFKPMDINDLFAEDDFVIGTVKTLEEKYGIEYLIKAFKILSDKYQNMPLKLLIVGNGSLENKLKLLVKELNLEEKTIFTGNIPFVDIPKYHNMLSVSVSVSVCDSESFGVAIIEASACKKPVVVSNVGGLPEVVEDGITGIVVPRRDIGATAAAIERLVLDKELRLKMGNAGRERVKRLYNWNDNVEQMIGIYKKILK
jgi:glycosyltransferase involved in cell wall biosynthesis